MRISKQLLKPIHTGYIPAERFSLRVQDGVEIYEHEALYTRRISKGIDSGTGRDNSSVQGGAPRLVVDESRTGVETLISKARSEISGLTGLLRSMRNLSEA